MSIFLFFVSILLRSVILISLHLIVAVFLLNKIVGREGKLIGKWLFVCILQCYLFVHGS